MFYINRICVIITIKKFCLWFITQNFVKHGLPEHFFFLILYQGSNIDKNLKSIFEKKVFVKNVLLRKKYVFQFSMFLQN